MPKRTPIIGGNLKMNGTIEFINKHAEVMKQIPECGVEVVMAPTALHLLQLQSLIRGTKVHVCAYNCYMQAPGAFTGEVAVEQLVDAGINYVIIGHSERRRIMGETNEQAAKKAAKACEAGLTVLFCVGETLDERNAGKVNEVNFAQLQALKDVLPENKWQQIVIAYEPVWAIGTGVVATPEQAVEVHKSLRKWLADNISAKVAEETRIQYGGSVNAKNCEALASFEDIDGFLVGGASMKPEFIEIVTKTSATKK